MNVRSIPNFVSAAALAAALQIGISSAHAASAPAVPLGGDTVMQQAQPMEFAWTEEKRIRLRHAYWLLEHANANYEGHKVKAMEHIKKAGEKFGIELHGKGYEGEHRQGTSDERLHEAKEELQKVFVETRDGSKELPHLEEAIKEINRALKVN